MAKIKAEIITTYEPTGDGMKPILPAGISMGDVTESIVPVVGKSVIVAVEVNSMTDVSGYIVLWSDAGWLPSEVPPQAEIDAVGAKLSALGLNVTPAHLAAISGMTRGQIADYIRAAIK